MDISFKNILFPLFMLASLKYIHCIHYIHHWTLFDYMIHFNINNIHQVHIHTNIWVYISIYQYIPLGVITIQNILYFELLLPHIARVTSGQ
jgi:hypothetical protein